MNKKTIGMKALIAELRALSPKRAQTFGMLLQVARMQAWKIRERVGMAQTPAINLIWLRDQQAVPVSRVPSYQLNDESGLTTDAVSGELEIYINTNEPLVRQRFTLLHEFKHALDFFDTDVLYARLGSGNPKRRSAQIERLANEFAAYVLMPTMLVKRTWFASQDVERLARQFCVSAEAMTTRLERLGLVDRPKPTSRTFFRRVGQPAGFTNRIEHVPTDLLAAA